MKLNRSRLQRIIREELSRHMNEQAGGAGGIARTALKMAPIEIQGSREGYTPEADLFVQYLLGDYENQGLYADPGEPVWEEADEAAIRAFVQALGDGALAHFRTLGSQEEIRASRDRFWDAIVEKGQEEFGWVKSSPGEIRRMGFDPSRVMSSSEITNMFRDVVLDAAQVAVRNLPGAYEPDGSMGGRSGMARPD